MPNYLHRTTKAYQTSVSTIDLPEPVTNYIEDPDISAVTGQPNRYWIITGDVVTLMDAGAQAVVDAALAEAQKDATADELDATQSIMKAFAEVVVDEINLLRAQHSLAARTLSQLKTAVRAKL